MSTVKKVKCPLCKKSVQFEKDPTRKCSRTVAGRVFDWFVRSTVVVLRDPMVFPDVFKDRTVIDEATVKCPNCGKSLSI